MYMSFSFLLSGSEKGETGGSLDLVLPMPTSRRKSMPRRIEVDGEEVLDIRPGTAR